MLSESQERMLLIAKQGREQDVLRICRKWDLDAAVVGRVTSDGMLRVKDKGASGKLEVVAEVPAKALADEGPRYERPDKPPAYQEWLQSINLDAVPDVKNPDEVLFALLESPTIASKAWVYEQYDHMVRTNTLVRPGSDAAVIRVKGTNKALAISTDGNGRGVESLRRRRRGRCGSGSERGVLRRGANRTDGLSELRESRAAGHHVAICPGNRRHQGRL
jgi:phosphoribosylformylglycinamidine synthase